MRVPRNPRVLSEFHVQSEEVLRRTSEPQGKGDALRTARTPDEQYPANPPAWSMEACKEKHRKLSALLARPFIDMYVVSDGRADT